MKNATSEHGSTALPAILAASSSFSQNSGLGRPKSYNPRGCMSLCMSPGRGRRGCVEPSQLRAWCPELTAGLKSTDTSGREGLNDAGLLSSGPVVILLKGTLLCGFTALQVVLTLLPSPLLRQNKGEVRENGIHQNKPITLLVYEILPVSNHWK